ncbi:3-hydroxyacyl-CoA dehydrogenase [Desulfofundulus thermocisternus]|uniref:3-hydroxyacyl-CoA dehydrogenase n=1 Tax=Desulfofundulus thermocisternus TaxID=42471 RepID=UPI000AB0EFB2|nr:3-hydroxyacyl-CoA dehydrogenase [Desulfofundulus thermocisternus]
MIVRKVAVIGAGTMGRGIAHVCALGGFQVNMQDVSSEYLEKSLKIIEDNMQKGVERGKVKPEDKEAALARISCFTDLKEAAQDVDLVIEAVPEDMKLKQDVFAKLDEYCPTHTILATNTSSMSITEIAAATKRPEKVIGLHFFNPVHIMKLVEIVCGLETSEETYAISAEACKQMGKETVKINEFPGFVTTRINALIGNEAFLMLQEGLGTPEDIDKALKLGLNHPMGPFEMVDLVGLDTRLKILEYLHKTLGEKYRPAPLLVKYVQAGRLGRKVGKGVYDYTEK